MKKIFLSLVGFSLYAIPAVAGTCSVQIERTCQPNQPCRTSENRTEMFNTVQECENYAQKLCQVFAKEEVAGKQVRASFDGQKVAGGANLCR